MNLQLYWHPPVTLRDGKSEGLIYTVQDWNAIPWNPGIYVFARNWGSVIAPLYIGQARNLNTRIGQQLNTTRLMVNIRNADRGHRILLLGELIAKPGQQAKRCLDILERAYIDNALTEGFDLLNKMGVKTPYHEIRSTGKKRSHNPFPRLMYVKHQR